MNYNRIRRLINEYLDGEIGLADKAQLEQIMADNPRVRDEYERLRKMGALLGLMPEVRVHPYKFRAKLTQALDTQRRSYFTPQRAFAAAMLVVMVVFAVTFGLYAYQQQVISRSSFIAAPAEMTEANPAAPASHFVVETGVSAEQFFSRLALESQVGLLDTQLLAAVMSQTRVYEGATCASGSAMAPLNFRQRLPGSVTLSLTPNQLAALAGVAQGLSGHPAMVAVPNGGSKLDAAQFAVQAAALEELTVQLQFSQGR